jgi:hypothetical protein
MWNRNTSSLELERLEFRALVLRVHWHFPLLVHICDRSEGEEIWMATLGLGFL